MVASELKIIHMHKKRCKTICIYSFDQRWVLNASLNRRTCSNVLSELSPPVAAAISLTRDGGCEPELSLEAFQEVDNLADRAWTPTGCSFAP